MIFVSYVFCDVYNTPKFGNASIEMEGIFSVNDIEKVTDIISDLTETTSIVILNWKKYDLPS